VDAALGRAGRPIPHAQYPRVSSKFPVLRDGQVFADLGQKKSAAGSVPRHISIYSVVLRTDGAEAATGAPTELAVVAPATKRNATTSIPMKLVSYIYNEAVH
jgi:hypothetical protein